MPEGTGCDPLFSGEIRSDIDRRKRLRHDHAALGRIHRGEPVEPLDEEVYEETSQEPTFPKALEATQALVREILPDLPEDEQKFLTMHIGVVLAQS